MPRGYPKIVIFVLATTLHLVAGNNYNNCNVGSNCSPRKNSSTRNFLTKERHESVERKIHLNSTKYHSDEQRSYKRDSTFTDVLKNLLSRVDNARRKFIGLNSTPQAKAAASPVKKPAANPTDAPKTTPAPNSSVPPVATTSPSASSTSGGTSAATSGSEATTVSGTTVTTSPSTTPTTTVKPSTNVSCNAIPVICTTSKPPVKPSRYNITIAPGIVLTPGGQIILNPQLPLLIGGGQTSGGKPLPGITPGAAQLPGTVSVPSGTVTSGHGAAGQQGRPISE